MKLVWLVLADDLAGLLVSSLSSEPYAATRLSAAAATTVWAGLAAPRSLLLAHVFFTLASAIHIGLSAASADAWAGATLVAGALPLAVSFARRRAVDLRAAAERDPLTGLLNRRGLASWASGLRAVEVTVLVLDLDGLRSLNKQAGHEAGDRALTALASALSAQCRAGQVAARLGGDEFVFVAPHAAGMAERVFGRLAGVSGGSVSGPVEQLDDLIRKADTALLVAKQRGGGVLEVS